MRRIQPQMSSILRTDQTNSDSSRTRRPRDLKSMRHNCLAIWTAHNGMRGWCMESTEGYFERKFREIMLFNGCLASHAVVRRPVSTADAIETKLRLAATIRADQALRNWSAT